MKDQNFLQFMKEESQSNPIRHAKSTYGKFLFIIIIII